MKIVNPIYDNAFKYLMDNEEIAKIVLSIILDTKVESLQSKPQETPLAMVGNINLSRFDFKAVIRTQQGTEQTVLVEIQKYKSPDPVLRFRQYLAQNYQREETLINENGKEETQTLPIITIYILGFDLPEFNCRAIRVDNTPYDIIGQKVLDIKSDFVQQLTHQSFILLAIDKPEAEKKNSRLEQFLGLFIQKLQGAPTNTIIDIDYNEEEDEAELKAVKQHLNTATLNEELIRRINAENEYKKGIANLETQVEEAKAREEEERRQKEEERRQKEEERRQKVEALNSLKIMITALHSSGKSAKEIAAMLNKTEEDVLKVLQQ